MTLRAYAQLVRLPALPTALADHGVSFGLLLLATSCLYCAGMIFNDFFDVEQDRRERPERPIPSGRVTRRTAGWLGGGLLLAGVLFAAGADWARPGAEGATILSAPIAAGLAAAILLY